MTHNSRNSDITDVFDTHYVIKDKIGSGTYGDVYKALHQRTKQVVAVKVMRKSDSDISDSVKKKQSCLLKELKRCNEIGHPGIVSFLDSGITDDKRFYTVFEYIEGKTLAAVLKENALAIPHTIQIMTAIGDTLSAAHKCGIIHRDLKPQNIMISSNGMVKILDFGIGSFLQDTIANEFIGTPAYASPEQLQGEPISEKTDIFAWGLLFLECLTGKYPFVYSSTAHLIQTLLSPSSIPLPQHIINHPLGHVLKWVLEKNHKHRAGSAERVLARLEEISCNDLCTASLNLSNTADVFDMGKNRFPFENNQQQQQVTIVYCHCTVDPCLDSETDSFEVNTIYNETREHLLSILKNRGGYCESESGSGLLFVFGYPVKSGKDAFTACNTALQLSNYIKKSNPLLRHRYKVFVSLRCCVYTAAIQIRHTDTSLIKLSGQAFLAARRCAHQLTSGGICINEECYTLVKNSFMTLPIPAKHTAPYPQLYSLQGMKSLDGSAQKDLFIGRTQELGVLEESFKRIGLQPTRAVLITGEPGIGKSALLEQFISSQENKNSSWVKICFSPEMKNSALFPFLLYIHKLLHLSDNNDYNYEIVEKFCCSLTETSREYSVALLCHWLHIVHQPGPVHLSPQKQKELFFSVLQEIIVAECSRHSSLLIIEDLHWADPTSIEFLTCLLPRFQHDKMLTIMTTRPEFASPWEKKYCVALPLQAITTVEMQRLVSHYLKDCAIPISMQKKLAARTGGNPLFAEELLTMVHSQLDSRTDISEILSTIPKSLREILLNRFAAFPDLQETLHLCSVIGRSMLFSFLEPLSTKNKETVLEDLDILVSRGILVCCHVTDDIEYSFRHALIRDVFYEMIPKDQKRRYHRLVAEALEKVKETIPPEHYARQWAGAGNYSMAVTYGMQALTQSYATWSIPETITIGNESLEWNKYITDTLKQYENELAIYQILFPLLGGIHGYASDEVQQLVARIEKILDHIPETSPFMLTSYYCIINYYMYMQNFQAIESILNTAISLAQSNNENRFLTLFYCTKGSYAFSRGLLTQAHAVFNQALSIYDPVNDKNMYLTYGYDTKVYLLSQKTLLNTAMGNIQTAYTTIEEALGWAKELHNNQIIGQVYTFKLGMLHYLRDYDTIFSLTAEIIPFLQENDLIASLLMANIFKALVQNDIALLYDNFHSWEKMGLNLAATYWNCIVAQTESAVGNYQKSLDILTRYIAYGHESGELYYLPELYRLKARCLFCLNSRNIADCEKSICHGIALSKEMNAKLFYRYLLEDLLKLPISEDKRHHYAQEMMTLS